MAGLVLTIPRHLESEIKTALCRIYEQQWLPQSKSDKISITPISHHGKIIINLASSLEPQYTLQNPSTLLSKRIISYLDGYEPSGLYIRNLGHFFSFIPCRIGKSPTLNDAVIFILTAYSMCFEHNQDGRLENDRTEYCTALKSLRVACMDAEKVMKDERLCTAVLLSWYEVLANDLDEPWLTHIRGTSHIIKLRGPSRHRSGFGLALLHAQEGLISEEAMANLKPCFLDAPSWTSILVDGNIIVGLPQIDPLNISNKILAQQSTALIKVNELHVLQEIEIQHVFKRLWGLRGKIREALEKMMQDEGEESEEDD